MRKLGIKNLSIVSIVLLVGLSVLFANYALFIENKQTLTDYIIKTNRDYVYQQSEIIQRIKGNIISPKISEMLVNDVVMHANQMPGKMATVLDSDSTILAASSSLLELGKRASAYVWFGDVVAKAIAREYSMQDYRFDGQSEILFAHRLNLDNGYWYFCISVNKEIAFAELEHMTNTAITMAFISSFYSYVSRLYPVVYSAAPHR